MLGAKLTWGQANTWQEGTARNLSYLTWSMRWSIEEEKSVKNVRGKARKGG